MFAISALALVLSSPVAALPKWQDIRAEMGRRPAARAKVRLVMPPPGRQLPLPKIEGSADQTRPLLVIDPGHGGFDPGARGANGLQEKDVTLALALALRDKLIAEGGVRLAMTRSGDRFLALDERRAIARQLGAKLFLSIHADSSAKPQARGATIYTLSEEASDNEAAQAAGRENAADGAGSGPAPETVGELLAVLDLQMSAHDGRRFGDILAREGKGKIAFRADPQRSAGFVVLRNERVPSVLFEAGYLSNPGDESALGDAKRRGEVAAVLARAVRIYFASLMPVGG